jgi:hypothetical protein
MRRSLNGLKRSFGPYYAKSSLWMQQGQTGSPKKAALPIESNVQLTIANC